MPSTHACLSGAISTFLPFGPARPSAGAGSSSVQERRDEERGEETETLAEDPLDGGVSSCRREMGKLGVVGVRVSVGGVEGAGRVRAKERDEVDLPSAESGRLVGVERPPA
jgi:hypothetical protein